MSQAPRLAESDSPEPARPSIKVRALACWHRIRPKLAIFEPRPAYPPKPAKPPLSAKAKEERTQWAVYLTFTAGWMLATWGVVLATGWGWLWPVSAGAFLMGAAGLVFWAMVQEKRGGR